VGTPAVFLRLAGCNLCCSHCDTSYAWEGGTEWEVEKLASHLSSLFPSPHLVVTGGEPLLQSKGLKKLLECLKGWIPLLETNATHWSPNTLELFALVTASPKLPSVQAGPFPHETFAKYINNLPPRLQVKMVVDGESDWAFVEKLLLKYPMMGNDVPLVIQPQESTSDIEDYLVKSRQTAEVFLKRARQWRRKNVRFIPQIHKMLWWKKRGV